jgi:hypothetical protein
MVLGAVAIVASTTVWAVGPAVVNPFSYVAIEDPISGNKVAVDSGRHLLVSDQLQAAAANPANFFAAHGFPSGSSCQPLVTPPAGKALIIKTLVVDAYAVTAVGSGNSVQFGVGSCGLQSVNPGGVGVTTVNYEPGIRVPAGGALNSFQAGVQVEVTVTGYLVPASWVPAPALGPGSGSGQGGASHT